MTEGPHLRPDGTSSVPVTPDPPQPPGSDLEQVVDEMSDSAVEAAHETEPPPEDEAAAPEGDAQHEPAD